jgi:hypothetical protein
MTSTPDVEGTRNENENGNGNEREPPVLPVGKVKTPSD